MQVSGNFVLRNSDIDNSEGTELYERIKKQVLKLVHMQICNCKLLY